MEKASKEEMAWEAEVLFEQMMDELRESYPEIAKTFDNYGGEERVGFRHKIKAYFIMAMETKAE